MGGFYWSIPADYTAADRIAWELTGGTYFYLPNYPSLDWNTIADYVFGEQDLWYAKQSGTDCDPYDFKGVAEAPENMLLDPEDYDISPEEIQVDNESWAAVPVPTASASWSRVNTETD